MFMRELTGGIYIDWGCSGVIRLGKGVFIPTDNRTSDSEKEFQEDLKAFLDKWFTTMSGGNDIKTGHSC